MNRCYPVGSNGNQREATSSDVAFSCRLRRTKGRARRAQGLWLRLAESLSRLLAAATVGVPHLQNVLGPAPLGCPALLGGLLGIEEKATSEEVAFSCRLRRARGRACCAPRAMVRVGRRPFRASDGRYHSCAAPPKRARPAPLARPLPCSDAAGNQLPAPSGGLQGGHRR